MSDDKKFFEICEELREIDKILEYYDDAIDKETQYILNSTFFIDDFFIDCGLSVARNFQAAVNLRSKHENINISFNQYEWKEFIKTLKDSTENEHIKIGDKTVRLSICYGTKIIEILWKGKTLYLNDEDSTGLCRVDDVLRNRFHMLNSLDFPFYYYNFVKMIREVNLETGQHPEQLIDIYCKISVNILSYCISECMFYFKQKVLYDVDRAQYT